jgi:sortase A
VRRFLGGVGRAFVTLGILILLFVAYQLWGTGLYTDREQSKLRDQFTTELRTEGSSSTSPDKPAPPPPPSGEPVAILEIPRIGVDTIVVNGVTREDLRKGPGHYPDTPLPGQAGNAAIAGHRTTYGAPFGDLDQLTPGDVIIVRTLQGTFRYRMTEQLIVAPSEVSVLDPVREDPSDPDSPLGATLTLTTCNPKYSAAQRLVIKAQLSGNEEALRAPSDLPKPQSLDEQGLSGDDDSLLPTVIAGLIAGLIGLLWWLFFHRHPRWTTWIIGAIPFGVALFFFYVFLERLLPANY